MKKIPNLLLLLIVLLFSSCTYINSKRKQRDIENTVVSWNQKEIILPDSLLVLNSGQKKKIYTKDFLKTGVKIFSIINNDCTSCTISQLMFWDSFLKDYENINGIQLVLAYCGTNDYFCNVLMEDIGIQMPVLLDESSFLLNNNKLFEDPIYRTVLLDKENKIILLGDFINNKDLEKLYLGEIEKRLHYL